MGDEEPGFPGVSLKKEEARQKREIDQRVEGYYRALTQPGSGLTKEEWEKAADEVVDALPEGKKGKGKKGKDSSASKRF